MSQASVQILLEEHKNGLTSREITEKLNVSKPSILHSLRKLKEQKKINVKPFRIGIGWSYKYSLNEDKITKVD